MTKRKMEALKKIYRYISDLLILIILLIEYEYIWRTRINILLQRDFQGKGNVMMVAVYMIVTILLFLAFGGFKIGSFNKGNVLLSQSLAIIVSNFIQVVLCVLMVGSIYEIGSIIIALLILTSANLIGDFYIIIFNDEVIYKMFSTISHDTDIWFIREWFKRKDE